MSKLQAEIEGRLHGPAPDVEVLLAELVGSGDGRVLRLFIDHPDGVSLDLCEQVSGLLGDYRERYSLEVSSPGIERPLTRPAHYHRFLGRRARVRHREAVHDGPAATRRVVSVTGELVGASDDEVTIAAPEGLVAIPYVQIVRSNLVPGD